jgi:hypothetical protein
MSVEDAVELGKRAIYHATHRDAGSGGFVRVYHVHKDGWTKYHDGLDVNELHWKFKKEKDQQHINEGRMEEEMTLADSFRNLSSFILTLLYLIL